MRKFLPNGKGGRLPTEQEWWAANNSDLAVIGKNQRVEWGPGGWTRGKTLRAGRQRDGVVRPNTPRTLPFPIESPKPVALGGSYKSPGEGALTREWLDGSAHPAG